MKSWVIIGLGNPGTRYKHTRHNVGFHVVECIADFLSQRGPYKNWRKEKLYFVAVRRDENKGVEWILAKPTTYMNASGKAVIAILKNHSMRPQQLILIHDDIDIMLGSYKFIKNRGSAGHRGVQSIINALGTKHFYRVRTGIRPPEGKPQDTNAFVMAHITNKEKTALRPVMEEICKRILSFQAF